MTNIFYFALTVSVLLAFFAACQPKNISQKDNAVANPNPIRLPKAKPASDGGVPPSASLMVAADSLRVQTTDIDKIQQLAQENNHFAADLYKHIAKSDENCFFSPYSISSALAMTYAGANGETAEQMRKAMRWTQPTSETFHAAFGDLQTEIDKSNSKKLITKVANRIWIDETVKLVPAFADQNKKYYGAGIEKIDFTDTKKASAFINKWVESQTNNLIKDLLKPENLVHAQLVLVNAIYFYGEWLLAFDEKQSQDMPFTTSAGEVLQTKFMIMQGWQKKTADKTFRYTDDKQVQVLELPYEGNKSSMVIVLPKENYSLTKLIKDLDEAQIKSWEKKLANLQLPLNLYLPKWKITEQFSVKEVLQKMGMEIPFTDAANFSGMVQNKAVMIGDVIHKAFVEVSEKGTEAAAATAVIMVETCSAVVPRQENIDFVANRPFLYYIKDNATGSILFMGHINNPK